MALAQQSTKIEAARHCPRRAGHCKGRSLMIATRMAVATVFLVVAVLVLCQCCAAWTVSVDTFPTPRLFGGARRAATVPALSVAARCVSGSFRSELFASSAKNENDDDEEEDDDDDDDDDNAFNLLHRDSTDASERSRVRKRWSRGETSDMTRPRRMVQPLGLDHVDLPPRIKTNFEKLMSGMPSMESILGGMLGDDSESSSINDDDNSVQTRRRRSSPPPTASSSPGDNSDNWFADEAADITAYYEAIWREMQAQLAEQKQADPASVPDSAEPIMQSVLQQELARDLAATKEQRALERLQDYQDEQRQSVDNASITDHDIAQDATVQRLWKESDDARQQQEASRAEMDAFLQYEQEAFVRAASPSSNENVPVPEQGADLDKWALQRLEAMAAVRESDDDTDVLDILEDNVHDLKARMEKEANRGQIHPETAQEWQMYRAIATQLAAQDGNDSTSDGRNRDQVDPERHAAIVAQLDAWKSYLEKEKGVRVSAGLARGPRLPFEWQELDYEERRRRHQLEQRRPGTATDAKGDRQSRAETRKQINRMSIEALESLLKTADESRRWKLQNEIDFLKSTLEGNDYLDWEEAEDDDHDASSGPVDLSGVFDRNDVDETDRQVSAAPPVRRDAPSGTMRSSSSPVLEDEDEMDVSRSKSPRPSTPFFNEGYDEDKDSDVDDDEVMDSMFRSVSAVGGGRYRDDPEERARQAAAFQEFKRQEQSYRRQIDNEESSEGTYDASFDVEKYAEDALQSLGDRPRPKLSRKIDAGAYSDSGGALARQDDGLADDDDDFDDDDADDGSDVVGTESAAGSAVAPEMPDWLRKENEAAGRSVDRSFLSENDIEEAFDDDHNRRQLAEYQQRRAGGRPRQMGIDISDILGGGGDSYDDYDRKYEEKRRMATRPVNWDRTSFEARKRDLLEYRELEVSEVNAAMDHKDSVYSTGVSQYMPRINKPFKEFGAIFRLEGVLVDINGLQMQAWTRTAESHGFRAPTLEDVQRAAVTRPAVAVREVFAWTDDFIQCGKIATTHRKVFREVFDEWVKANSIDLPAAVPVSTSKNGMTVGADIGAESIESQRSSPVIPTRDSEQQRIDNAMRAWSKTAEVFGFDAPSRDSVVLGLTVTPDVAVKSIFRWIDNAAEADNIVRVYGDALVGKTDLSADTSTGESRAPQSSQNTVAEYHYQAWQHVADSNGLEKPEPDEVMAAMVINDPVIAIRDGFAWADDRDAIQQLVKQFETKLSELMDGRSYKAATPSPIPSKDAANAARTPSSTESEVLDLHRRAWAIAAETHGLDPPTMDQVKLAVDIDPSDVIQRLLQWTNDPEEVAEGAETFQEALKKESAAIISKHKLTPNNAAKNVLKSDITLDAPLADELFEAAMQAWTKTALAYGHSKPSNEEIEFAFTVGPEEAIMTGFEWTQNQTYASEITENYLEEMGKLRKSWAASTTSKARASIERNDNEEKVLFRPVDGARQWIQSLQNNEMGTCVVSYLDRDQVNVLLHQANLGDLVPADRRVTATDNYGRDTFELLGAALRLERRPDHCVVFDSSPYAPLAAHDVDMRAVAMVGAYPRYDLLNADTTSVSFDELTAMNIRRLFGERVYDEPMVDVAPTKPENQRRYNTETLWDETE